MNDTISPTTVFILHAINTKYPNQAFVTRGSYRDLMEQFVTWTFTQEDDSDFSVLIRAETSLSGGN